MFARNTSDPDTLALWLEKWPSVERIDPGTLISLACALRDACRKHRCSAAPFFDLVGMPSSDA